MDHKSFNFNQNVTGNNNATSLNLAGGDISSSINIATENIKDINDIIEDLKTLIIKEEINHSDKESMVDDLDTIQEQLKNDKPKKVRISSAVERIKQLASKIPSTIAGAKAIFENANVLYDKIQPIIESIF